MDVLYYFTLHHVHQNQLWQMPADVFRSFKFSVGLCPAIIMIWFHCFYFFKTNMEIFGGWVFFFFFTDPSHLTWREKKSSHLVLAEWLTELSKKKRKTAAWRNSVIAYWKAAGGEAWCPWHAWNSIYSHCQTSTSETQCHGIGDICKQFPVLGQSSCNTIQIWEEALG